MYTAHFLTTKAGSLTALFQADTVEKEAARCWYWSLICFAHRVGNEYFCHALLRCRLECKAEVCSIYVWLHAISQQNPLLAKNRGASQPDLQVMLILDICVVFWGACTAGLAICDCVNLREPFGPA